jgi:TetR/AcrR family transcriptional repressor of nem operon
MARPREFDPDVVVERAMQVFWAKGYEATSLDDLCEATQLNRSSLYSSFGDKHTLFLATLDRYGDRAVAMVAAALSKPVHIRESLGAFLAGMVEGIVAGPQRTGCFIGNCTSEVSRHDREAALRIQRNVARIEATFRSAFEQAKKRGDLRPDSDVEALARFFVVSIQGLRLMGKTIWDRDTLEDVVGVMLRSLD